MIKINTVFEWLYRAAILWLLYNCYNILTDFVQLAIIIYGA